MRAGRGYRRAVRQCVAASALPHGYTLTIWTTGAVTARGQGGPPTTADAFIFLVGATAAFGLIAVLVAGLADRALDADPPVPVRIWGALHLPSAGLSLLLASWASARLSGSAVWLITGFVGTATYLIVTAAQVAWTSRDAEGSTRS